MSKLSDLPNISTVLSQKLMDVGICSPDELKNIGSKDAFVRIRLKDPTACFSMFCAIEGAIQGIRWHFLDADVKKDLRAFFDSLK